MIRTESAPAPFQGAPYNQAIRAGDFVYVAGQGPTNPKTGQRESGSVEAETRQVLENVKAILEASGASLADVVKTTCYLANMDDFQQFNGVYAQYFTGDAPARTTIQAARLPGGINVEVDAIAYVGEK